MASFSTADWRAIKWYMEEHGYRIKDMQTFPTVRFRNGSDGILDIDLPHIKAKYLARPKPKRKKVEA